MRPSWKQPQCLGQFLFQISLHHAQARRAKLDVLRRVRFWVDNQFMQAVMIRESMLDWTVKEAYGHDCVTPGSELD